MRVLISFTLRYALYGQALLRGLREARPGMRLRLVPLREAGGNAGRLRPRLVFSDEAVGPTEPFTMRAGDKVRRIVNPTFGDLLAFVDEFVDEVGRSANRDR